ncbi:PLP-dependent transferase [Auricularia subglabra TFB-10046 SS5]|nr:PLP-dependent transferase [Auricularia subglabra TFB-10046 SS5]
MTDDDELRYKVAPPILATLSPPIPLAYTWVKSFIDAHPDRTLLDFAQGAPGAPPPPELLEAVSSTASQPEYLYKYGLNDGEPSLREALATEIRWKYGGGERVDVQSADVAITAGCNLAFFAAIMCVAQRGDEVILPIPWYFNHHMALTMLGITAVPLPTLPEDGFVPCLDVAERLITSRTRAIVFVSPNNPTGAIYPDEALQAFFQLAQKHGFPLIIDETYRDFVPGAPHSLFSIPAWRSSFIHLFSFSKSYAIPGARLGAVVASPSLLKHVDTALDTLQICPARTTQVALAPLLPSLRPFIASTTEQLKQRHAVFRAALPAGWDLRASGGYFAFIRHPYAGVRASALCEYLARTHGVIMLPATFFGFNSTTFEGIREVSLDAGEGERWIRASVASVPSERMAELTSALKAAEHHFLGVPTA